MPVEFQPYGYCNCASNELIALVNRVLKPKLPFVMGYWKGALNICRRFGLFDGFTKKRLVPLSDSDYLATPTNRKKRSIIEAAIDQVRTFGLFQKDFTRKSFVKVDLMPAPYKDSDPRLIQAVSEKAQYVLARWIIPFSKKVAKCWSFMNRKESCVTYASGYTPVQLGYWRWYVENQLGLHRFVEVDFHRWDATLNSEALKVERSVFYGSIPDKAARRVLKMQAVTHGYTSKGYVYDSIAGRKSGDCNTSVGNSILNAITTSSFFIQRKQRFNLLVLGDDMLCAFDGNLDVNEYEKHLRSFGLDPEIVVHDNGQSVSFCSAYFWHAIVNGDYFHLPYHGDLDSYVMGPKPDRLLSKFGYMIKDKAISNPEQMLRANIRGLLPHCNAIPVVRDMLRYNLHGRKLDALDVSLKSFWNFPLDCTKRSGTWSEVCEGIEFSPLAEQQYVDIYHAIPVYDSRISALLAISP